MSLSLKAACVMLWYACSPRMIVEDRGSNDYQFGIYYFPSMHATKRSKTWTWFLQNQCNVSDRSDTINFWLLLVWATSACWSITR